MSPVPLESWTADMGGRGVTILAAFQSRAQLLARWGEHAAATILNNTSAVMVFGGTRDRDDLQFWSTLTGERDERVSDHGSARAGRVAHGAAGAGARTGADREPADGEGAADPPWPRADRRAGDSRRGGAATSVPTSALWPAPAAAAVPALEVSAVEQLDRLPVQTGSATDRAGDRWEIPAEWFTDPGAGPEQPGGGRPEGWDR